MRQVFQKSYLSKALCVEEVPAPVLQGIGALVQNAASLISPGTERATVSFARKGLIAKAQSQPERLQLLLRKMKQVGVANTLQLAKCKLETPIPLGYSTAGIVLQASPDLPDMPIGARVACAGSQYANHAEVVYIPKNLCVPLPDALSFEEGSFVAPGAIALHGVRLAKIGLGETVLIIGLGLIGQLTAQLVAAHGGIPIGIDLDPHRLELASKLGMAHAFHRGQANLEAAILQLTQNRGADSVLITAATPSSDPIYLAGELCREKGRVVVVGDVGMQVPRSIYYHKEISLVVSRSYGPGRYDENYETRGQEYPAAYVRWSERDNMAAFLRLAAEGKIQLQPLIERRYPVAEAVQAYDLLMDSSVKPQPLGIVLTYPAHRADAPVAHKLPLRQDGKPLAGDIGLSLIGAGNFLNGTLLPLLKRQPHLSLRGVASRSGLNSKNTGLSGSFSFCSTDYQDLLDDPHTQAILIATRHDSHANLLCQALQAGKHAFVEKPMAINRKQLQQCTQAIRQASGLQVMTGFNRRFAPLSQELKKQIHRQKGDCPLTIHYRVLAGFIPEDHWVHQDGGRIVGELCHFIDWCQFITDEAPKSVYAHATGTGHNRDISIQLALSGGSIAQIEYAMRIDPASAAALGKEKIEVLGAGWVAEMHDFTTLRLTRNGKTETRRLSRPDKGHSAEIQAFVAALQSGKSAMPIESILLTTETTFAILDSLQSKQPEPIHLPENP